MSGGPSSAVTPEHPGGSGRVTAPWAGQIRGNGLAGSSRMRDAGPPPGQAAAPGSPGLNVRKAESHPGLPSSGNVGQGMAQAGPCAVRGRSWAQSPSAAHRPATP